MFNNHTLFLICFSTSSKLFLSYDSCSLQSFHPYELLLIQDIESTYSLASLGHQGLQKFSFYKTYFPCTIYDSQLLLQYLMSCHLEFAVVELLVRYSNSASDCGMNVHLVPWFCNFFFFLALVISFAFLNKQVVGGIDDQIPSLPSTTGVQVVTYSKLLSQVIN